MSFSGGMRLIQKGIVLVKLTNELNTPPRIMLTKHKLKVACVKLSYAMAAANTIKPLRLHDQREVAAPKLRQHRWHRHVRE